MRFLVFLASMGLISLVASQSINRPCDSCVLLKLQDIGDSSKKNWSERSSLNSDSILQLQKLRVNSKTQELKTTFDSKTDSSARAGYRNKAKETAMTQWSKKKELTKSKWEQIKSKVPERKELIKFNGQMRSESYATTAQNPMMRNEPMYIRLYISPTITLFGLPFTSNFFFTTEANNTYKNNFFSIRFDVAAMRQQAADKVQKEMDDAKKLDRLRQVDLQKNALETKRYQQEMDRLKNQIPDFDNWKETLEKEAEEKSKDYLDKEKKELEEKLKNVSDSEKEKLKTEFENKKDSVIRRYTQQVNDSMSNAKLKASAKGNIDTSKFNKYLKLQSKLEQLQSKKKELDNLRQMDSAGLSSRIGNTRNPDDLKKMVKDKLPGKHLLQSLLSIDRFGIGLVNPQYSEFTLYAASVKGLDMGINKKNYYYDLTIGKTTRQFTGPYSNTLPIYDRDIAIARFGLGKLSGNHVSAEFLYAFDNKPADNITPMVGNGVLNLNARITMLNNTLVEGNMAQSTYKESYLQKENIQLNPNSKPVLGANANKAYLLKATQTLNENIKLEAQLKQTGAAFRTVGNPFLRRNFREVEFKYEHKFFKKKVNFSGFYKEMRDNLIEINTATNRFKGYGLKLYTVFDKYPNITMGYSPYQQGNNHPDSIYRTNNQFSITTATITYKKRYKNFNWNALANFTRSAMEINQRGRVAYKLISTVHTIQIGQRNSSMISYLLNITAPFVDSLNSKSIQFTHNYLARKNLSFGMLGEHTQYKNGALKAGAGLQVSSTLFRNFTLSIITRYDRINKLWHLENANVYTGKVVVVWKW